MSIEMREWLERVAILLEFLSFWFVAPELLGVERLEKFEAFLKDSLRRLSEMLRVGILDNEWLRDEVRRQSSPIRLLITGLVLEIVNELVKSTSVARVASLLIGFGQLLVLVWAGSLIAYLMLDFALDRLKGNAALRRILIILGIFFFIVSTVIQLVLV